MNRENETLLSKVRGIRRDLRGFGFCIFGLVFCGGVAGTGVAREDDGLVVIGGVGGLAFTLGLGAEMHFLNQGLHEMEDIITRNNLG